MGSGAGGGGGTVGVGGSDNEQQQLPWNRPVSTRRSFDFSLGNVEEIGSDDDTPSRERMGRRRSKSSLATFGGGGDCGGDSGGDGGGGSWSRNENQPGVGGEADTGRSEAGESIHVRCPFAV